MKNGPPRVLLLTDADVFAGTERHIADLDAALRARGLAVSVACPTPSPLAEAVERSGGRVVSIQKRAMPDWRAVLALRRLLRRGEVDLIHAHNGRTALLAAAAVTLAGRGRCVTTQHFLTPNRMRRTGVKAAAARLAHAWTESHTSVTVAISNAVREAALNRGESDPGRIVVVHNGIAAPNIVPAATPLKVRQALGIQPEECLVLCASRLEAEKDLITLVRAMEIVTRAGVKVRCAIAGSGSLRDQLESHIRAAKLMSVVKLLGFRSDVDDLINAADIFVLPCPVEGFGLVVVEAMAHGKPVIAAAAGGPAELVEDGGSGLLVAISNPDQFANAILHLAAQPLECARMGARGRELFIERFTAERMAAAMEAVYRRALGLPLRDGNASPVAPSTGGSVHRLRRGVG